MASNDTERTLQVSSDGVVSYSSQSGVVSSAGGLIGDGEWHMVLLTHYSCNSTTNLYVDGVMTAQDEAPISPR